MSPKQAPLELKTSSVHFGHRFQQTQSELAARNGKVPASTFGLNAGLHHRGAFLVWLGCAAFSRVTQFWHGCMVVTRHGGSAVR